MDARFGHVAAPNSVSEIPVVTAANGWAIGRLRRGEEFHLLWIFLKLGNLRGREEEMGTFLLILRRALFSGQPGSQLLQFQRSDGSNLSRGAFIRTENHQLVEHNAVDFPGDLC